MRLYKGILYSIAALIPYMFSACSDSEPAGNKGFDDLSGDNQSCEVTFNISIGDGLPATRAYDAATANTIISQGTKIDRLTYAIFSRPLDSRDDVSYTIDSFIGEQKSVDFKAQETYQLIVKVSMNKEYRIVCWAQDSECGAYNTEDFPNVTVSYDNATNNDESRDAFCASEYFRGDVRSQTLKVELRRPFAQINIGTSGADYANLIYDETIIPHGVTINQSTITVTGVADRYNVLTGEAFISDAANTLTADFAWGDLPAWEGTTMPTFGNYTKVNDPFVQTDNEEFLIVRLNEGNGDPEPYLTDYATVETDDQGNIVKYLTETFKYLSMCYVLVPTVADSQKSTVGVVFNFQQKKGNETSIPLIEKELNNVPVQANYRTNILGGLHTADKEPDPTSIFTTNTFSVILQDNFDYHYVSKWDDYNSSTETTD